MLMSFFEVPSDKALTLSLTIFGLQTMLALVGGVMLQYRMWRGQEEVASTPAEPAQAQIAVALPPFTQSEPEKRRSAA